MARNSRALFAAVFLCLLPACREAPPHTEQTVVWAPVGTWTGRGNTQTESFTSQTGSFKFTWTSKNEGTPAGHLKIVLHSAVSGRPLVEAVDHLGDGGDWIYVNEDPREFYVVVDAERTNWTLKVEEGISLVVTSPAKR